MRICAHRWPWIAAVALVAVGVLVPVAQADNLNVRIQRIDVSQFPNVRAYVSIATSTGVPIPGLDSQSVVVQEDGAPVSGLVLNPTAEMQEPIVTALVFNVGASMANGNKLDAAKNGALAYIDSLAPNDRTSVVSFASRVTVVQDYTTDKAALRSAIDSLAARGNTLLFDAIDQTARRQRGQPEARKPIILLTDSDDSTSTASLGVVIATASTAGAPVYSIGIGSNLDQNVLTQISSGTGGEAVFAADPNDLKSAFLSIDDFLRRQYVLRYTSKLTPDNNSHGLAVQATSAGQQGTGLTSFKIPAPATVTVGGLTANASVTGIQHVTVDVSGGAPTVQLLVDDQVRGTAHSVPTAFDWDTQQEAPGSHRVVVRVTDAQGVSSDSPYSIVVTAPAALPGAAPTAPAVDPTKPPAPTIDTSILIGVALLLFLIVAVVWYLNKGGPQPAPATAPASAPPIADQRTQARNGKTLVVDADAVGGMTMARQGRERIPPQVRLAIVRNGRQSDFGPTRDSPITLGRARDRASVVIDDPLVSSEHVRIRRDGTQFVLEDLKSRNGTQVNGVPISPETPRPLNNNDRIYLGDTVVTFVVDAR